MAPKGEKITEASMRLSGTETYIRVECVDEYGQIHIIYKIKNVLIGGASR